MKNKKYKLLNKKDSRKLIEFFNPKRKYVFTKEL